MKLGLVEAPAVSKAPVLAEALAMVRGDDHPGPLERSEVPQIVEQQADLLIEVGDAAIVGVASEGDLLRPKRALVGAPPVLDEIPFSLISRPGTEPVQMLLGDQVGVVGIEVIQENEERSFGLPPPGQPGEEFAIDHRRFLAIAAGQQSGDEVLDRGDQMETRLIATKAIDLVQSPQESDDQRGQPESTELGQ